MKLTPSLIGLVTANMIPLGGILFLGWEAGPIVLVYWWENLIVGFYNILRMALLPVKHVGENLGKLFTILFFYLHYGGFCDDAPQVAPACRKLASRKGVNSRDSRALSLVRETRPPSFPAIQWSRAVCSQKATTSPSALITCEPG